MRAVELENLIVSREVVFFDESAPTESGKVRKCSLV